MSTIFLIGMPGVGKSHWGRIWSRRHGFALYDLDELIVQKERRSIAAIMEAAGESGFRKIETGVLAETLTFSPDENRIVSCGGGTPTIAANIALMKAAGCIVYLDAPPDVVLRQLQRSPGTRPLLKDLHIGRLEELLQLRRQFYEQADFILPLEKAGPGTFAEILTACINRPSLRE